MGTFDLKKFLINEGMTLVSRDRKRILSEDQVEDTTKTGCFFDDNNPVWDHIRKEHHKALVLYRGLLGSEIKLEWSGIPGDFFVRLSNGGYVSESMIPKLQKRLEQTPCIIIAGYGTRNINGTWKKMYDGGHTKFYDLEEYSKHSWNKQYSEDALVYIAQLIRSDWKDISWELGYTATNELKLERWFGDDFPQPEGENEIPDWNKIPGIDPKTGRPEDDDDEGEDWKYSK